MANKHYTIDINNCGFVDPQIQLGSALSNGNIRDFRIALEMGAEPTLQDDKHTSIFEKALKTHGCAEFVDECLRRGCNPNHFNDNLKKTAVNFATDSRDPQILNVLLRQQGVQVDYKYAQLTPLNSLAKNLTSDNLNDVVACIKLLANYGASPNIPDQREMTPLHHILKNRKIDESTKRELVQVFLSYNDLDLDSFRDGEVRNILRQDYPDLQLPPERSGDAEITFASLLTYIRSGDEEKFLEQYNKYQLIASEKDNNQKNATQEQNMELLMEATKRCLHRAFDELLQTGLNINMLHDRKSAIEIAAIWGNWQALEKLLKHENLEMRHQDQLLISVIRKLDEAPINSFCNYQKCFDILLDSDRVDVNKADISCSTPLHYAVKYRNHRAIQQLLKRGAYIGTKSAFNDLPIDGMHPEVLEQHFDSCISTNGLKPGDENFEILMDYTNLMPRRAPAMQPERTTRSPNLCEEMTPIAFIADSKEHRHLLQHPLITSFLFLKWHRLSVIFYINFLLYSFFAVSIITYTILKFRESEHQAVTTLFGLFSWIGIGYMILREIIQIVMSPLMYFRSPINYLEIALIILSVMTCIEPSYDLETQRLVAVFTILLVAGELCLLVGSLPVLSISTHMLMLRAVSKSFLKSFGLYSIFVITFSLCFYILFGKPEVIETTQKPEVNAISEMPELNEIIQKLEVNAISEKPEINEIIQKLEVNETSQKPEVNDKNQKDPDSNGEFNKFTNPFTAVIKTVVMLTGEFDAGDIDFDSLYSYLIFLLFVFFMSIVLFNLLNGLAVSDTQAIKAQAELNGSICRANLLTRYEEVLIGRSGRASFVVNHEPFRTICRRLMNVYPNYIAACQISIMPNNNNKVMIPIANSFEMKNVLKRGGHNDGARNSKTSFLPLSNSANEAQKKLLDPPVSFLPCCCTCITGKCSEMDSRTVKLAIAVIEQRATAHMDRQRVQSTERRLQNIEEKLEKMFALLQDMQTN